MRAATACASWPPPALMRLSLCSDDRLDHPVHHLGVPVCHPRRSDGESALQLLFGGALLLLKKKLRIHEQFSRALMSYCVKNEINPMGIIPVHEKDGTKTVDGKEVEFKKGDINDDATQLDEVVGWIIAVRLSIAAFSCVVLSLARSMPPPALSTPIYPFGFALGGGT